MTKSKTLSIKAWLGKTRSVLLLIATLVFGIAISAEAGEYVIEGIDLAVKYVIPSALPFMIISDLYMHYGHPEDIRSLAITLKHILGFSEASVAPFICGNIGGFPIGAKLTADAYKFGKIPKGEAERLIALSNNPSCAFIIGGVGMGIFGNVDIGIKLLLALWSATVLCGFLTKSKITKNDFPRHNAKQNYNFVTSVKESGLSLVSIISFISIFSCISGIVKKHVRYAPLFYTISAFLEVTNAVKCFSEAELFAPLFRMSLVAFSLGFGGVSVAMQSSLFASSAGLSMKKYYLIKLLEGLLCATFFTLLYIL